MKSFLEQVARHYYRKGDISSLCFIFPSRRSITFFKKHLGTLTAQNDEAIVTPRCLTINDFFYTLAGKSSSDRVLLLLKLYDCYKELNPGCESLDDFIFWGDVLLSDFDDTDKYLADPRALFSNVSDFKDLQDGFEYLSDSQREALGKLFSHFSSGPEGKVKSEFKKIWNLLYPLYLKFREELANRGMAYEGMAYRDAVKEIKALNAPDVCGRAYPGRSAFVFVGLNALNACEQFVLGKMRDCGLAEFVWDWSGEMIRDPHNKSSFFLKDFYYRFPQAFELEEPTADPVFTAISVPSSVGQAKMLPRVFGMVAPGDKAPSTETAIVLPDEGMMIPVLNSIPENISKLNVTMGYPMNGTVIWSLFNDIAALRQKTRLIDGRTYFYHKSVWSIFSNNILKSILGEEGRERIAQIKKNGRFYICEDDFKGDPVLEAIFRPCPDDIPSLSDYLMETLGTISAALKGRSGMAVELDFAKELYLSVKRLKMASPQVNKATFFTLLTKICASLSVPFKGEPLEGLQIMGPLETRALDFENVIFLNFNEGVFPRHSTSSSFIPPEIRRAFGLPTYEYQDAVWAYYFYRLIRRSRSVTMLYDSRSEGLNSGEQSRYLKQLTMHFNKPVNFMVATADQTMAVSDVFAAIPKTQEQVALLKEKTLSVSALQTYLHCPAQFYFKKIAGLKEEDEVSESLDAGMFGKAFHRVMELLYKQEDRKTPRECITLDYLSSLKKDYLKGLVRECICEELHSWEIVGKNLIYQDLILGYVQKVIARDLEMMKAEKVKCIRVLGIEKYCEKTIEGFKFNGVIDRMDSLVDGIVRIVDYKTGAVSDEEAGITDENAEKVVNALFGPSNQGRPKIALQLYIYDLFAHSIGALKGASIQNSIYSTGRLFRHGIENQYESKVFNTLMQARLKGLLDEISDTSIGWRKANGFDDCKFCKFKSICGK